MADSNIVAAAIVRPDGWTARQFKRAEVEFFVPEALRQELAENAEHLASRAGFSMEDWSNRCKAFLARVHVVSMRRCRSAWDHELVRRVERADPDDAAFAAAMVAVDADFLWTRDGALLEAAPDRCVLVLPEPET